MECEAECTRADKGEGLRDLTATWVIQKDVDFADTEIGVERKTLHWELKSSTN